MKQFSLNQARINANEETAKPHKKNCSSPETVEERAHKRVSVRDIIEAHYQKSR